MSIHGFGPLNVGQELHNVIRKHVGVTLNYDAIQVHAQKSDAMDGSCDISMISVQHVNITVST